MRLIASLLLTIAMLWCVCATAWQIRVWVRTPSPLPIPLAPVPRSQGAVVLRLLLETLLFRSLARASLSTWLPAMAFHYGLLLILLIHVRLLLPVLPVWFVPLLSLSGLGVLLCTSGLIVLLLRRIVVDRVRYVSSPSDYLHLILLLAIVISGVLLKRVWPASLHEVGEFVRGVFLFDWHPLPDGAALAIHVMLVIVLLAIFPISKLLHGAGVLVAPTFVDKEPRR